MQFPLDIQSHSFPLTRAIETAVHERAAKLTAVCQRITKCRVVLETRPHHHRKSGAYQVRIDLVVPGAELVANHQEDENLYVAVRDAFAAVQRQLEEYLRHRRDE